MKPISIQNKKVFFNKTKTGVNAKMSFALSLMNRLGIKEGTDEERTIKMLEYDSFIILTKRDIPEDYITDINNYVEKDELIRRISELTEQLNEFKDYLSK